MGTPRGGVGGDTLWGGRWGKWGHLVGDRWGRLVVGYRQGITHVVYFVYMFAYCLFVCLETGEHSEC